MARLGVCARTLPLSALVLSLANCLEYSPHVLPMKDSERDLHRKAVERLLAQPAPARVRFVVVGDTQQSFDEAKEFVKHVNRRDDVHFVVQMGDFTHLGLWFEYREMNEIFRRLRVPYFVVVGIHDFLANGGDTYSRMFGPFDFAFTYGRIRFVLFDSNSREHGFPGTVPNLAWLEAQLQPGPDHDRAIPFSHEAPNSADFDPALVPEYRAVLDRTGQKLSLHGHAHEFQVLMHEDQVYVIADSVDHRSYLVVTETSSGFEFEKVDF